MPLHLLGKKGWNVYNTANIAQVKRDEAEAQAREEAAEQRMQEEDAARRLAFLRGEEVAPLPAQDGEKEDAGREGGHVRDSRRRRDDGEGDSGRMRKRRRLRGEDDTERDIRYAREDAEAGLKAQKRLSRDQGKAGDVNAPLQDHAGHISLIPAPEDSGPTRRRRVEKNSEAEAEKAHRRKMDEDQYTMRFSNAAGFRNDIQQAPWYASRTTVTAQEQPESAALGQVQEKDVWGNPDPRRKALESHRVVSNDPLAAMQVAQQCLKQSRVEKEKWAVEREAAMKELREAEERKLRRQGKRRRREESVDSLQGFSLNYTAEQLESRNERHSKHHHSARRRSRSLERHRAPRIRPVSQC